MPAWLGPVLGSVASSLIGGIFDAKQKPAKAQGIDYAKLRKDSQAAGFNPLTALLAGGGAGYQRVFEPQLSSGSFIAEAMQRGLDTYFAVREDERADAEAELIRQRHEADMAATARRDASPYQSFGYALTDVRPFSPERTANRPPLSVKMPQGNPLAPVSGPVLVSGRPLQSPISRDPVAVPVELPGGEWGRLDKRIADRLDVPAFGKLMAGDLPEVLGEVVGEAKNLADAVGTWESAFREDALTREPLANTGESRDKRDAERKRKADEFRRRNQWMIR